MKENIILCLPNVWSYRNFIISGIYDKLRREFNVFIAVPEIGQESLVSFGIEEDNIIPLIVRPKGRLWFQLMAVLKIAHHNKNPTITKGIFEYLRGRDELSSLGALRVLIARLFTPYGLFKILSKIETALYQYANRDYGKSLKRINPKLVISTAFVSEHEWGLLRVAQFMRIRTATHILSFDNLTSRGYLPLEHFSEYYVWNKTMAEELISQYRIRPSHIFITGTPQFDFHAVELTPEQTNHNLTRGFNISEQDDIILYCANHFNLTPSEPELLDLIMQRFRKNEVLEPYRVILRLHPMDNYDRWKSLLRKYPEIIVSQPWQHRDNESTYWGSPSKEDILGYSLILKKSSIVLNISSTVSIDAAILDTPVVCIGFHPSNKKENEFYKKLHYSDHYSPIMGSGAIPLALSMESLEDLVCSQLKNRGLLGIERVNLKNKFIDGKVENSALMLINRLKNACD